MSRVVDLCRQTHVRGGSEKLQPQAACRTLGAWPGSAVLLALPDEADVHAQAAVDAGTGQAYVHTIGHRGPGGVLGRAIKTDLTRTSEAEGDAVEILSFNTRQLGQPTLFSGFDLSFLNNVSRSSGSDDIAKSSKGAANGVGQAAAHGPRRVVVMDWPLWTTQPCATLLGPRVPNPSWFTAFQPGVTAAWLS